MRLFQKTLILVTFIIPLLTACDSDNSNSPEEAVFDKATFDKSTWK